MSNIDRLRRLINMYDGDTWDKRVERFAAYNGRSKSSVYRWLTQGCPENILDATEYRLTRP